MKGQLKNQSSRHDRNLQSLMSCGRSGYCASKTPKTMIRCPIYVLQDIASHCSAGCTLSRKILNDKLPQSTN